MQAAQAQAAQQRQQEEQMAEQEAMRNSMLARILDHAARARLNSVKIVKPEKARMVEGMLINMARQGQLQGKVSENMLIGFLGEVTQKMQQSTTVSVSL